MYRPPLPNYSAKRELGEDWPSDYPDHNNRAANLESHMMGSKFEPEAETAQ